MNRTVLPLVILIASALLATGCTRPLTRWEREGHAYTPPAAGTAMVPEAPVLPEVEKPLFKVIAGQEVSGIDEALAQAATPTQERSEGLRTVIDLLHLKEVPLVDMAASLSEMSGYNIAVTKAAAAIPVSIFLQDIALRQALETVCRLYDLWYREDERIITLMTTGEYSKEMVVRRNEKSRAFWLRYSNANDMAKVLQAVMGSQVVFNDIGKEEVYGHVAEDKKAGGAITVQEETPAGGGSGSITTDLKGFQPEEIRKLLALGNLREGRADALDMHEQLAKRVPAVITVFKRNNAILARSLDETILEDIGRIIEMMDSPTPQVLLEISILQLNLGDGFESFFQLTRPGAYSYAHPDNSFTYDPSGTAPAISPDKGYWTIDKEGNDVFRKFNYTGRTIEYAEKAVATTLGSSLGLASTTMSLLFGSADIQARLQLYAKDDRVEVLATPYLMSANNSKVKFFIGEEVPLRNDVESKTLYNSDGQITTNTFDVNIKREELGTDIDISSFINEDGTITMTLEAEISAPLYNLTSINVFSNATGTATAFPLDGVERSKLNSVITAVSGQPLAIGGIIRERLEEYEKKVPVLGDIPILGFPFKEVIDRKVKSETIFLITPHIIRHPGQAWSESKKFLERRSSHPRFVREQDNILDYPIGRKTADTEKKP
jgi:type II secretory pathway component GspD/PulD (secretin)